MAPYFVSDGFHSPCEGPGGAGGRSQEASLPKALFTSSGRE